MPQPKAPFAILQPDRLPAHDRGGGARTTPLVTPSVGSTTFINGITEIGPGTAIPFHSHNCEESVILLSGEAWFDVDGEEHPMKAFDTTFIAAGIEHRFRNRSDSEPLRILWTYATADATRTLATNGETRRIATEHAG